MSRDDDGGSRSERLPIAANELQLVPTGVDFPADDARMRDACA